MPSRLHRFPIDRQRSTFSPGLLGMLMLCVGGCGAAAEDVEPQPLPQVAQVASALTPHVYAEPPTPSEFYEPPTTNVVFVSPTGNDSDSGSLTAPFKTLGRALAVVNAKPAGPTWTIVLRAGTYREGELSVTRDNVTLQRYQSEVVRLWGSTLVTGFTGSTLASATLPGDMTRFEQNCADDHLLQGANRHFGAEYALGVFRAGVPLRRVASQPQPGEYTYDHASNVLTVAGGSSNVEVTTKLWALRSAASNVKLAGLDVRGYGTCTVDWSKTVNGTTYYKGAILLYKNTIAVSNSTLENSTVANNSASAVAVANAQGVRLLGNRVLNNGWTGIQAGNANGLVVSGNDISYNNVRRWANAVDAGMKITRVEDGVIFNNLFEHNAATGFWCDQHCGSTQPGTNWFIVARNTVRYNDEKGIFYEVSHHGVIASNLVHDNALTGIAVFGSRTVQLWNNTLVNNEETTTSYSGNLSVVDDNRCVSGDTLPGGQLCDGTKGTVPVQADVYDRCEPSSRGDLANTCNAERITLKNNLIAGSRSSRPLLNVEDPAATAYGAGRIISASDFQAYWRSASNAPSNVIEWQKNAGSAAIGYTTLAAFQSANPGYEGNSVERVTSTPSFFVDYAGKNFTQNPGSTDVWGRGAPLPSEVLKAIYWPETNPPQPTARIGAIEWKGKAAAADPCPLASAVHHRVNPTTGDSLYTLSESEAQSATAYGYTDNRGVAFRAAGSQLPGLSPVYRLMNPSVSAHLFTPSESERSSAMSQYGFTVDEGIGFYASMSGGTCLTPVYRLQSPVTYRHLLTVSTSERDLLISQGWADEGIRFYAATPF